VCKNTVNLGTSGNAWAWDSAGNRDQVGLTEDYGAGNRLLAAGTTTFYHDLVGRVTCRIIGSCPSGTGAGYKYQWDALGRLRSIRNGSSNALIDSLSYDARGRRVRKQLATDTTYFVYEGDQIVFDLNAADSVKREYAWYPGGIDRLLAMRTPTDTLAALLDPVTGTVRGLARFRNGARVKEYNEAPWGDAVADTGLVVRYRFAGREWDPESGLYYMRARYYDPTLGRWVSEDPLGLGGGGNLFGYAGGDPVNLTDPFGFAGEVPLLPEIVICPDGWVHLGSDCVDPFSAGAPWGLRPHFDPPGTGAWKSGDGSPVPTNANKGERNPFRRGVEEYAANLRDDPGCRAATANAAITVALDAVPGGALVRSGRYVAGGFRLRGLARSATASRAISQYSRGAGNRFAAARGAGSHAAAGWAGGLPFQSYADIGLDGELGSLVNYLPIIGSGLAIAAAWDACLGS
jgi:RHS repeat-associated protein